MKETIIRLWEGDAPHALGSNAEDVPEIKILQPSEPRAGSVVVLPGGGYRELVEHEKTPISTWLNGLGLTAIVLKYRVGPRYRHPAMLKDAARAIRTLRGRASDFGLAPDKIAVMGFSAGGHLASSISTLWDKGDPHAKDPTDRISSRPDASILVYPVISMVSPWLHQGSKNNLLGENPSPADAETTSAELRVTPETPPTFIFHPADDKVVPVQHSLDYAAALARHKVPFDLHVYESGGHGVTLGKNHPHCHSWPAICENWLRLKGW